MMTGNSPPLIHSVDLEIRWARLVTIMDEVDAAVARTSFSTIVGESRDFGVVMMDGQGRSLAQSQLSTPAFTITLPITAKHLLQAHPPGTLKPGDVLVTNDPWLGSGHLPDFTVCMPVFHDGTIAAIVGCVAHLSDVGGRSDYLDDKDLFEEGLRIPPTFLMREGEPVQLLMDIIAANSRAPRLMIGDLSALCGALALGAKRLTEFLDDYGLRDLEGLGSEILSRSRAAMSRAVERLPEGVYTASLQADGHVNPITIAATVTIAGGKVDVDFAGSSPEQLDCSINASANVTFADTYYPFKCSLLPDVPNNEGLTEFLTVRAPLGSVLNARFPRAVRARSKTSFHISALLYAALAPILGEQAQAASGSFWTLVISGEHPDGESFRAHMLPNGGKGAVAARDGLPTIAFPYNGTITPVEIMENNAPVIVGCRELLTDSGGPGRYRGGLGQRLTFSPLDDRALQIFVRADKLRFPPQGLAGGEPGALGALLLNGNTAPNAPMTLAKGDIVELRLPGGGGYGPAGERPRPAIIDDLAAGYVSPDAAATLYKFHLSEDQT
ncbi:hydantoinase B/oxoprolinase family protein [Chelatococcus sp. HY11]|uniref:hydantoinase B/oxoprolinase family protein n=2 Tax=unclassified Chelatococcus TaxID=2638111 RepID=UPI001BCABF7A|nr:hydantoinase B/oxoprolinase family protein [Chelatococcus sp. HY11]MBS7742420.1 hydantoinase B/oxoprolinase family protein [Chelatococcus sp. HY11]CAH1656667.1 N-methylhydantoinase B [Hyphomicrobiales bacterium]CAH1695889.1 N-methylhydantoinase B [Hyphomicrobiales bacterium]